MTGLVGKPRTFAMEDLLKMFPQEDRIYRLRCVEAWSMVIPWQGFPLASLLKAVEPTAGREVCGLHDPDGPRAVPRAGQRLLPLAVHRGPAPGRGDERSDPDGHRACTARRCRPQDGAPLRLVVPWKYGFKSIKAIVKIELMADQPETFWKSIASNEYGFYANVNPDVPHPRWLQSSERRIGELSRRPTLMFNGYAEQVAHLYEGMDLAQNY